MLENPSGFAHSSLDFAYVFLLFTPYVINSDVINDSFETSTSKVKNAFVD